MKSKYILAAYAVMASLLPSFATEVNYSYADLSKEIMGFGSPKADSYDIAVKINIFGHDEAEVAGLRVLFPVSEDISGLSAWISTELKLENGKNVPDLVSVEAKVENSYFTASFPEGFKIPKEGLYVGYSFTVEKHDAITQWPVAVGEGTDPNGLFIHTAKKYYSWLNYYENLGMVSAMEVTLSGDFKENDGTIEYASALNFAQAQTQFEIPLLFTNFGSKPIVSMEFEYSFDGGAEKTASLEFTPAKKIQFTGNAPISVFIDNEAHEGANALSMRLAKINGIEVNGSTAIQTTLNSFANLPKKRPLVEEYTGLWCGYCPRGWAALDYMSENYPEDFVAISYHSRDGMSTVPYYDYPVMVSAFPVSTIDRKAQGDPFFGEGYYGFGFLDEWKEACNAFTPAEIAISGLDYDAASKTINVSTETSFIMGMEDECGLFYVLVADGLEDPSFMQANYLTGEDYEAYGIPQMEQFLTGASYIAGLVYDDVPVAWSSLTGIAGSLPPAAEIAADQAYTHSFEFVTEGLLSDYGMDLIGMAKGLRVIAGVTDMVTGEVLNCAVADVDVTTGINDVLAKGDHTVYFDLSGNMVNPGHLAPGVYVRNAGGKSEKIIVK